MEGDHARVRGTLGDVPLDPLVGTLLDDLRLEPPRESPHLDREERSRIVALVNALESVHELGPVLELSPAVVGDLDRHGHVDRLLDRHPPAAAALTGRGPALVVAFVG